MILYTHCTQISRCDVSYYFILFNLYFFNLDQLQSQLSIVIAIEHDNKPNKI